MCSIDNKGMILNIESISKHSHIDTKPIFNMWALSILYSSIKLNKFTFDALYFDRGENELRLIRSLYLKM